MILNCLCKCLLFSINYSFCQYLSSLNILLKIDFTRWKSVELPHIGYTVIHNCFDNTCYLSKSYFQIAVHEKLPVNDKWLQTRKWTIQKQSWDIWLLRHIFFTENYQKPVICKKDFLKNVCKIHRKISVSVYLFLIKLQTWSLQLQ